MNKILIAIVAAAVLGVAALTLHSSSAPLAGGTSPIDQVNYHCWAGVCHYYGSAKLKTATSTPCAIQSPAATSTLGTAGIRIDVSSSTATIWDMAQAATAFATTTGLGTANTVAGSAQAFLQASSSPGAGAATVLSPNSWIVFGARQGITAGDTAGTGFVPSGSCYAVFTAAQS